MYQEQKGNTTSGMQTNKIISLYSSEKSLLLLAFVTFQTLQKREIAHKFLMIFSQVVGTFFPQKYKAKLNWMLEWVVVCWFGVFFPKWKGWTKLPWLVSAFTSQKELARRCLMYVTNLLYLRAQCITHDFWLRMHNCHICFPFYKQILVISFKINKPLIKPLMLLKHLAF